MDDTKKVYLQRLAEDEKTLEALKEFLLDSVDANKLKVENGDNALLGEKFRALVQARELLEEGIKNIKRLKVIKRSEREEKIPGR